MYRPPKQSMEKYNTNSARNSWCAAAHVHLNDRTDSLLCIRVEQLSAREAGLTTSDLRIGIAPKSIFGIAKVDWLA